MEDSICLDCTILEANGEVPDWTEQEVDEWFDDRRQLLAGLRLYLGDQSDEFGTGRCVACGTGEGGYRHAVLLVEVVAP